MGYWLAPVGFPIRTSPDQSLVADSPKLFAGSNVLHRLQLPRHPPYALIRLTIYRNNRPGAQPQILFNRCCAATCHRSTSTPDMRSTRNSCVYLTHSLRRSRKLPPPQSRYHTSTLLKNLPGAKPRLQQPAAPRPDARVWTLSYPRHQRTEILPQIVCVRPAPRYRHTHHLRRRLVELSGIEPLTSCVQGRRSPS